MRSWLHGGIWVVLVTFLLFSVGLAGIYGLNWFVFHPTLVSGFIHTPLFERPQPADVIVVLAQDVQRIRYATSLVERGFAPRMLSTLVDTACLLKNEEEEALCATGVRNTVDEALTMRRMLVRDGIDRVMIVTSRDHVVRAAAIFTLVFFGSGLEINIVATPLSTSPKAPSVHEVRSFFPSLGGAVLGRVSPELYEWLRPYGREFLHGRSNTNTKWIDNPSS